VKTEPVIVDGSAEGGRSPGIEGSAEGGTSHQVDGSADGDGMPPADPFAPELLVVRLRGYDREAELHYFDQQAAGVLAPLRETLPTDGDFPAALVEVFRLFRVAVGHARTADDLPELLGLARDKVRNSKEFRQARIPFAFDDGEVVTRARRVLASDPRPKVFTAAEERQRFRVRLFVVALAVALGMLLNRCQRLARPSGSPGSPGSAAAQTTK
jgi:hypothetical protein